jgi:hypothetical protein
MKHKGKNMKVRLTIEDDSGRTYHGEVVLDSRRPARTAREKVAPKHAPSDPTKPAQSLKHLHQKGIFKTERDLGAVEAELAKIDCNFPKPSLAKALSRADFLTRRGSRGTYRWIQRHKPGA